MQDVYAEDPNELEKMAMQIQSHLSVDYSRFGTTTQTVGSEKNLKNLYGKTIQSLDFVHGGKKSSQKFPLPPLMRSLLEYQLYSNNVNLDKFNTTTLNKIADGEFMIIWKEEVLVDTQLIRSGKYLILKKCFMIMPS